MVFPRFCGELSTAIEALGSAAPELAAPDTWKRLTIESHATFDRECFGFQWLLT